MTAQGSRSATVWMDDTFTHVMVYTGDTLEPERAPSAGDRDRTDDVPAECVPLRHRRDPARAGRVVARALGHLGRGGGRDGGAGARRHRRGRVRRARVRPRAGEAPAPRAGHADRPARLPPVPAAALSGGDLRARGRRRGGRTLRALSTARFDRGAAGRRDRGRSGCPLGHARRRPNDGRRLPGPGGRKPGELLRHPGHRPRLPAVLAGRRAAAPLEGLGRVRGGASATRRRSRRGG